MIIDGSLGYSYMQHTSYPIRPRSRSSIFIYSVHCRYNGKVRNKSYIFQKDQHNSTYNDGLLYLIVLNMKNLYLFSTFSLRTIEMKQLCIVIFPFE